MKAAGVRRVRLYDCRHSALTFLAVSGVPGPIISAWAGHSDLSMAAKTYIHPALEDLRQGADKFAELLG
jgi:integrase